jgi:small-conductance mechanosensitive channel
MKKLLIIFIITLAAGLFCTAAQAQLINSDKKAEIDNNINAVANEQGAGYDDRNIDDIIASIIRLVVSIVGVIFIVLVFISGNNWMLAGGNEEKAKKAKDTIAGLLTGLAVLLVAYALASGMGGLVSRLLLNK